MTCQDSFHEVAFNISFWTRNISSARILFWRGVHLFIINLLSAGLKTSSLFCLPGLTRNIIRLPISFPARPVWKITSPAGTARPVGKITSLLLFRPVGKIISHLSGRVQAWPVPFNTHTNQVWKFYSPIQGTSTSVNPLKYLHISFIVIAKKHSGVCHFFL